MPHSTVVEGHSCLLTVTMRVTLYTARCRSVYTERDVMVFGYTRPRHRPQRSPVSAFSTLTVGLCFLFFLPSSSPPSPSFGGAVDLGMREACPRARSTPRPRALGGANW